MLPSGGSAENRAPDNSREVQGVGAGVDKGDEVEMIKELVIENVTKLVEKNPMSIDFPVPVKLLVTDHVTKNATRFFQPNHFPYIFFC